MPTVGNYRVSSNNPREQSEHHQHCTGSCRVKLFGVILASVDVPHSDPLTWMRRRPQDAYRKELVRQLLENNVSVADIAMIMELPDSKKNL
jgi:hypothetical protein